MAEPIEQLMIEMRDLRNEIHRNHVVIATQLGGQQVEMKAIREDVAELKTKTAVFEGLQLAISDLKARADSHEKTNGSLELKVNAIDAEQTLTAEAMIRHDERIKTAKGLAITLGGMVLTITLAVSGWVITRMDADHDLQITINARLTQVEAREKSFGH